MMNWFNQLAPRERLIVGVGALLAALIVGWRFVWTPLDVRSAELATEVAELSRLVVDLERAATLRGTGTAATAGTSSASPMALVEQTARPLGLASKLERTRQEGPNAIYVTLRDAPFDLVNAWLTTLELEHGLSVVTVSGISFAGTPGLVNGQILLARA